jgi:hypothetical protein
MSTLRNAFQMPSQMNITGRSSSITAAFVASIIPRVEPSNEEIETALKILEMTPDTVNCAYCGDDATEWDHFRPIVKEKYPTGFITEIRNLVPSCGKCNQSKGNYYWKQWMLGAAPQCPRIRKIPDLENKMRILEEYEKWGNVKPLALISLVDQGLWEQHWQNRQNLQDAMLAAQSHANKLRDAIEQNLNI